MSDPSIQEQRRGTRALFVTVAVMCSVIAGVALALLIFLTPKASEPGARLSPNASTDPFTTSGQSASVKAVAV